MRSLTCLVAATAVAVTLAPLPALAVPTLSKDKRPCVTKREWREAKIGMKKSQVHALFDTAGRFADGGAGGYSREYQPCNWDGGTDVRLFIEYRTGSNRVGFKSIV